MTAHMSLIKAPAILYSAFKHLKASDDELTNSIAAIKESVSALEALLNELGEIGKGYEPFSTPDNKLVILGKAIRESEGQRMSTQDKVKLTCKILSGNTKLCDKPLYHKFLLVLKVRDGVTHPKASVINLVDGVLLPPIKDQQLIERLKHCGFECSKDRPYDWTSAIQNKKFAEWAHLSIVELMIYIFSLWPYPEAVDSYLNMYGLNNYINNNSSSL